MIVWCNLLGVDKFVTFIVKNVTMLETDLGHERLLEWHHRIGEGFQTFMAGGIGQYLLRNEINNALKDWFCILQKDHFCKIFGNTTIMA